MADDVADRMGQLDEGFLIEDRGLRILQELTLSQWERVGKEVLRRYDGSRWVLGDWMAYGEGLAFQGRLRAPTGHTIYEHAMTLTGLGEEHLAELARTAEHFPQAVRTVDLSWSFYRIAKGIPGGLDSWLSWLNRAHVEQWTVRQFSTKVADHNASLRPEEKAAKHRRLRPRPDTHVQCPGCARVFPVKGHRVEPGERVVGTDAAASPVVSPSTP